MSRILWAVALFLALCGAGWTQGFSGLARIDPETSRVSDAGRSGVTVELGLSQGVPYRLFTLAEPPRLVLDFQEVDWTGLSNDTLLQTDRVGEAAFGGYVPGWSRMVLVLAEPLAVETAELSIDDVTGAARLSLALGPVSATQFAQTAGAPRDARWDLPDPAPIAPLPRKARDAALRVMLDPGHGGIDPGAEAGAVNEKGLMLTFARELRDVLLRSGGFEVIMTRDDDRFVSLEQRVAMAHRAEVDVFLSLHADSLSEGLAHGATVYLLAEEASDVASAKLAERHDRAELLSGLDLTATDDQVTDILLDLARAETAPRAEALANSLVDGMAQQGGPMNRRPLRQAAFSVLKAADIPSALIELGFMSSPRDLRNLQDAEWRSGMAVGIRNALRKWREEDQARKALVRQ
ncbi:N-acetylmuramoyl-L-alanine amidase [Lutimaribacter marinistellae]|uniref:N-acetylmuramoyl-L-alanine amidase n=1 Tax=Lutimaribacter marinistellae TaxID=1820329 RepID=A0ABV7TK23_9RHOB